MSIPGQASLIDILRERAANQPSKLAYRFLLDGAFEEVILTYEDLDRRARSIAAVLQSSMKAGERALLLLPSGLDFIAAFFGCLYARIIAVPAYPPHPARLERTLPNILGIIADAAPTVVLLSSQLFDVIRSQRSMSTEFGNMKLLVVDNNEIDNWPEQWQQPVIDGSDIAFLQYTSGSTTAPRGVIVSHRNLMHNLGLIENNFGQSSESHAVIWLPPYHDMGLVGGILQPLYSGYPVTLMPHMMFLQRPYRWLQAISRFRATTSGGPNFAYDLCIRKIKPEQRDLLDLSCWEVAFNGAEQVYHKTLEQFAAYFAPCGFQRKSFVPCYGLAEATLMVVGGPKTRFPLIQHVLSSGLEENRVIISPEEREDTRSLVSCGRNLSDQKVRIVHVDKLTPCPGDEVGEIWVSGPSVSSGYWNKPVETAITFGARLTNSEDGSFLRTGDLGFLHEGELYITGRLKNLIIWDGKNHHPHDIERTVEGSHPAIRPTGCAVFSIHKSEGEGIVVIAEMEHQPYVKAEEVINAIRKAVTVHHELHVDEVILTKPGVIPRTTSGKIRHFLCKKAYITGTLKESTFI